MNANNSHPEDTIAAIATAPGRGGVGIIRISGPQAVKISTEVIGRSLAEPRYALFCHFLDQSASIIDEGLSLYFPAPNSFTGEDVVELQGHGGPVVMDMLLQRCIELGARIANPGEFSERAFLNDKLDLAQAEAIADLIDSETQLAARSATRSLQGVFSEKIQSLVNSLIHLRMYVEAAIDFPEEEIDFLSDNKVSKGLQDIIDEVADVQASAQTGQLLRDGMQLVIAGKPNAGKSSLLNALSGNETAIVTDIPGTTRDVLKEQIQIEGMPLHLIDTAGIRETEDVVEKEGVRRAQKEIQKADRILWLYDADDVEENKLPELNINNKEVVITYLRNKIDKCSTQKNDASLSEIEGQTVISLSIKTGEGLDIVRQHLLDVMGYQSGQTDGFIARRRHLDAIDRAAKVLDKGQQALENELAGELLAEDLRYAQNALSEITGEFTSDDLLGEIFSSFCIGK